MKQITPNIYGIFTKMGYVNFYLIVNGDVLTVVDTGLSTADIDRLQKGVEAAGHTMEQIQHILITHAHTDHIGGLPELQRRCNAQTYAHRLDAPIIRGGQRQAYANPDELGIMSRMMLSMMQRNSTAPARVDTELNGDETLDEILPGLEVVHLPGHSYGHIGFWLPEEKILFGGDIAMNLPWGITMPPRPPSPDWVAAKKSVSKVVDLEPRLLLVGHGQPIEGDVAAKLAHLRPR